MVPYFTEKFGNASSIHRFGQEARAALDESREMLAGLTAARASEIVFVGSGTEADKYAIKGTAWHMLDHGKDHIITDAAEHHAVLETCEFLGRSGFSLTVLPVDSYGMVDPGLIRKSITKKTGLVSIMHANNEVGTLNPIGEIAAIAKEHAIIFHTDAVQSFGKVAVPEGNPWGDLVSMSAHKIYGPKGIGALFVRNGVGLERFLHGGGQERGKRAGTESVALAVGFARAAAIMAGTIAAEAERMRSLKMLFMSLLRERFPYVLFNGHPTEALSTIVNVSFDDAKIGIDGEALLFNLDLEGIAAASGSACTSGSIAPSHVLLAMGRDPYTARATVRFSMGRATSEEEIRQTVDALVRIVRRIGTLR